MWRRGELEATVGDRASAGQESQWDWLELPDPPAPVVGGAPAAQAVAALSWWRVDRRGEDQPYSIEAVPRSPMAWVGWSQRWRFDRWRRSSGVGADHGQLGPVALHYQVGIAICPPNWCLAAARWEKSAHTYRATRQAHGR